MKCEKCGKEMIYMGQGMVTDGVSKVLGIVDEYYCECEKYSVFIPVKTKRDSYLNRFLKCKFYESELTRYDPHKKKRSEKVENYSCYQCEGSSELIEKMSGEEINTDPNSESFINPFDFNDNN